MESLENENNKSDERVIACLISKSAGIESSEKAITRGQTGPVHLIQSELT